MTVQVRDRGFYVSGSFVVAAMRSRSHNERSADVALGNIFAVSVM